MAKNNNKPKKNKPKPLERRARRDIRLGQRPALNQITRAEEQLNLDTANRLAQYQSIFGGAGDELQRLAGMYDNSAIQDQFNQDMQQFASGLTGAGLPASEVAAATGLYSTTGANSVSDLASQAQRQMGYAQSAQRENQLSGRYTRLNELQNQADALQQLQNRRLDIKDLFGAQYRQRLDELRAQAEERRANQALVDFLTGQLSGATGTGRTGPGRGPSGPSGPNAYSASGGTPSMSHAAIDNAGMNYWSTMPDWLEEALAAAQGPEWTSRQDIIQGIPKGGGRRRFVRQNWDEFARRTGWNPVGNPVGPIGPLSPYQGYQYEPDNFWDEIFWGAFGG